MLSDLPLRDGLMDLLFPLIEPVADIVRDPALLPLVGAAALAVACLPWWTVLIAASVISIAAELLELRHDAHLGFVFGQELFFRLLGTVAVFGALHFAAHYARRLAQRNDRLRSLWGIRPD